MRYLLAIAAVIGALALLVMGVKAWEAKQYQAGYDAAAKVYAEAALKDSEAQREEEQRRVKEQNDARTEAEERAKEAANDASRAAGAAISLRQRLNEINQRNASSNTRPDTSRETAAKVIELFGNCATRYSEMARDADASRNAGLLCERLYTSLKKPSIREQVKGTP